MVFVEIELSESYWKSLEITQKDIEYIYSYLLEKETPLPSDSLAEALINQRIRSEKERLQEKQRQNGEIYLPKSSFEVGDKVQFPAVNWISGVVKQVREGHNPELPEFNVITVDLENGRQRQFAANLEDHQLNQVTTTIDSSDKQDAKAIIEEFGPEITEKLLEKLDENKDLVRIGPNWFPKSLLIEFNVGHLNLAEAVLDMHQGGPLGVDALLKEIDVDTDDPQDLVRFSLNYALNEDPRFDEVGPSGHVQWFLNRLEPEYVREKPIQLMPISSDYDPSSITEEMRNAVQRLDDELVEPFEEYKTKSPPKEVAIALNYPHWRVGSIPITSLTRPFFPTALESPRVKFKVIAPDGQEISAWVVRPFNYIYGLKDYYEEFELMPGSIITIKPGKEPGEVLIQPKKKRSNREWIRTLLIGADGGVVFAMLKQTITADYNERMAIAVPSTDALDELWEKRSKNPHPLKKVMVTTMRELAKLNPQGHVHSVELYSAVNCIQRFAPGAIFSTLATDPDFTSVGDLYYRLSENS